MKIFSKLSFIAILMFGNAALASTTDIFDLDAEVQAFTTGTGRSDSRHYFDVPAIITDLNKDGRLTNEITKKTTPMLRKKSEVIIIDRNRLFLIDHRKATEALPYLGNSALILRSRPTNFFQAGKLDAWLLFELGINVGFMDTLPAFDVQANRIFFALKFSKETVK